MSSEPVQAITDAVRGIGNSSASALEKAATSIELLSQSVQVLSVRIGQACVRLDHQDEFNGELESRVENMEAAKAEPQPPKDP